jgi:Zn-dependent M28 family amino/carboxypeptidase
MLGALLLLDQPIELMNADRVGTSDFAPFRRAGIPALSIHSIAQDTLGVLHTQRDTLAAIDRDAYYQSYRTIALYLALLDSNLRPRSPGPPASE